MGAEQTPQRPQRRARPEGTALRKIPLPALPHFRPPPAAAPTPASAVAPVESAVPARAESPVPARAEFTVAAPAVSIVPARAASALPAQAVPGTAIPERTGDSGAAVLNHLVDQIEREIESHLRHDVVDGVLPAYRNVLACAHDRPRVRR